MKRIVHPKTSTPQAEVDKFLSDKKDREQGVVQDKPISDISIDSLLGDGLLSLYREMKNLLFLSSRGKLSNNESRDLRDTVKLLFELKDREKELMEGLETDAILDKLKEESSAD